MKRDERRQGKDTVILVKCQFVHASSGACGDRIRPAHTKLSQIKCVGQPIATVPLGVDSSYPVEKAGQPANRYAFCSTACALEAR